MNRNDLTDRIAYAERDIAFLKQIKTNCTTCEHYNASGFCKLHQGKPPAEFVAIGCDDWLFDDVPF